MWKRVLGWTAIVLGVLAVVFYVGGGWYFSNLIDSRALDGASMRASLAPDYSHLEVTCLSGGEVGLRAVGDAPQGLTTDGLFGLRWDGGYGQIGAISSTSSPACPGTVRRFTLLEGTAPTAGTPAELDVRAYPSIPSGVDSQSVTVPGPLGDYPAWFVPGHGDVWAIVLHGNSMTPLDGVRAVPIFAAAGMPVLVPTYRNDPGAPEDPTGMLRYGLTEWQDLEADVRYALDHGAKQVVLDGYSMGGGIIMAFLQRSALADKVAAVILDAPMLDFSQTVNDNAAREKLPVVGLPLPSSLTAVAKWMAGWRFGVDWHGLNYLDDTSHDTMPFLVFHGTDDLTVPIGTSEEFRRSLPGKVTLVSCPGAGHIACWNTERKAYIDRVRTFLDQTVGSHSARAAS